MSVLDFARATVAFTRDVELAFERKKLYLRSRSYADTAVAALFRRSTRIARAIATLAEVGAGADAVVLSRSLIENWIVLRWLTNQDYEARGRVFWRFEAKQKERVLEVVRKYPPSKPGPFSLRPGVQQIASEYRQRDSWGTRIKEMAEEPELLTPDAWLQAPPGWTYDVLFYLSSFYLHPSPIGLRHEAPQGGSLLSFGRMSDEDWESGYALAAASAIIANIGNRASVFWGLGLSEEIAAIWDKKIKPFQK